MEKRNRRSIDFDSWVKLAREDPDRFEALRRKVIERAIERAPSHRRRRLRGLQWRIDNTRALAPNPTAACESISKMMWDSLAGPDGLLERLRTGSPRQPKRARVVTLSRRQ